MELACIRKPKGLVWHKVQLKKAIKIVQSKNTIKKCDLKVRFESVINRHDSQVRSKSVIQKCYFCKFANFESSRVQKRALRKQKNPKNSLQ